VTRGRGVAAGLKFMTSGPLKTSSRVRGITSFAESYGVLHLADGDIRHKKPALVSALFSLPGPDIKRGRLHPPHLRAVFSPVRLQVIYFQGIRSAETGKNRLNSGPRENRPTRLPPGLTWAFLPLVTCVPITRDFTTMIREESDQEHW
jgi:hypothetical protein